MKKIVPLLLLMFLRSLSEGAANKKRLSGGGRKLKNDQIDQMTIQYIR